MYSQTFFKGMFMLFFFLSASALVMSASAQTPNSVTVDVADVIDEANLVKIKIENGRRETNSTKLAKYAAHIDELIIALHEISPEDRAMLNNPNRTDDPEPVDIVLVIDSMLDRILHLSLEKSDGFIGFLIFYKNNLQGYLEGKKKKTATPDRRQMRVQINQQWKRAQLADLKDGPVT